MGVRKLISKISKAFAIAIAILFVLAVFNAAFVVKHDPKTGISYDGFNRQLYAVPFFLWGSGIERWAGFLWHSIDIAISVLVFGLVSFLFKVSEEKKV